MGRCCAICRSGQRVREQNKNGSSLAALALVSARVALPGAEDRGAARARALPPAQLVNLLNDIFSIIDGLTEKHGLDKIKTLGDAYMVASGIAKTAQSGAEAAAAFALDVIEEVSSYGRRHGHFLALRIGMHTGTVVSGVIGLKKFSYDLWGETVNLASRLEAQSEPGHIQVSESTYRRLGAGYRLQPRGPIYVRGIGEIPTYFLLGRAPSIAGTCPSRAAS
jgi:adenylate cyclase